MLTFLEDLEQVLTFLEDLEQVFVFFESQERALTFLEDLEREQTFHWKPKVVLVVAFLIHSLSLALSYGAHLLFLEGVGIRDSY